MSTQYQMDPELKTIWVANLRSGKYHQNNYGHLRVSTQYSHPELVGTLADNRYSPLGVLADILGPHCWRYYPGIGWAWVNPPGQYSVISLPADILPPNVQEHIGDPGDDPRPFSEVADWIEAHL